mgnify:CR=1 FL=1
MTPIVKNAFVESPGLTRIIDEIECRRGEGHKRCPDNLVVVGPSGSGKTTLIKELTDERFPRTVSENNDKDIVPLLSLSFQKDKSTLAMVNDLITQLGDPETDEKDIDKAYERLWHLLDACCVEFICFDEFHNIRKGRTMQVSSSAEKFVKDLNNHSKVIMIAFGTAEVHELISAVDELDTRFDEYLYMPSFSVFDGKRPEFVKYLIDLSEYADIDNRDFLYDNDMPERFYITTGANPRRIARLIHRAIKLAKDDKGRRVLEHKDLYEAALKFGSSDKQAQVFRLSQKKLKDLFDKGDFEATDLTRTHQVMSNFFSKKRNFLGSHC